MEENKKSKLGLGILIGVLVALVIGLAGFIVYDKVLSNDNNNNDDKQDIIENQGETITDLSLDSTIVQSLSSIFYQKYNAGNMDGYDEYFYKNNKTNINSIPNKLKLYMVIAKMGGPNAYLLNENFDSEYNFIFGKNNNYTLEEVQYGCNIYYACNDGKDFCLRNLDGCGGAVCGGSQTKLAYAKQITSSKETRIEIYEHFYYVDCDENGYYSDYNKTNLITKGAYVSPEDIFEKYSNQLGMYKYTFVKNSSDTYVFTSVERVK